MAEIASSMVYQTTCIANDGTDNGCTWDYNGVADGDTLNIFHGDGVTDVTATPGTNELGITLGVVNAPSATIGVTYTIGQFVYSFGAGFMCISTYTTDVSNEDLPGSDTTHWARITA